MNKDARYHVRAVHCDHRASQEEVYRALVRATAPLELAWEKLEAAERITIKFNSVRPPDELVYLDGQLQESVDPVVVRALLCILRERTKAEIRCLEISSYAHRNDNLAVAETLSLASVWREFGAEFVDGAQPPHRIYRVPGGGSMFDQYLLPESAVDTDAFISVQKLKSHHFTGLTLCLKNLFGLPPMEPPGRSRTYFHHITRMPYVLVDLGLIMQPTLNIIDGLVGQAGREWGGVGRIADTLIAGDQVIATDACGAHLMGHDPLGDWPEPPFHLNRNMLRIAHERGFGTADLDAIDFQSEVSAPVADFYAEQTESPERALAWQRSMCEQALTYRDHPDLFAS